MRISYTLGRTVNLGDFNSVKMEVSIEDEVKTGETREDALLRLQTFVKDEIRKEIVNIKRK